MLADARNSNDHDGTTDDSTALCAFKWVRRHAANAADRYLFFVFRCNTQSVLGIDRDDGTIVFLSHHHTPYTHIEHIEHSGISSPHYFSQLSSMRNMSSRRFGNRSGGILIFILVGVTAVSAFPTWFAASQRLPVASSVSSSHLRSSPSSAVDGYIQTDEVTPRDVETMEAWALQCGVQRCEGFELMSRYFQDGIIDDSTPIDVSIKTSEALPGNAPILFVPAEMVLSSQQAMLELGPLDTAAQSLRNSRLGDEMSYFYLMLKVLVEYEKGFDSPWYPWLNSLPRYFSNGASMTDFCFECLPPFIRSLATKERDTFVRFWENTKRWATFLPSHIRNDVQLCRWAYQIAVTRGFPANGDRNDIRIAPMADFFNHGAGTELNVQLYYDEQGNCNAYTTTDVSAGSQLCTSYGDPTNPSHLLARFGFLDESSPATFCKYMPPNANTNQQLVEMGYVHNRMLFYKDTGEASEEVFDVLLYQLLGEIDIGQRKQFYDAHMSDDYDTKQAFHQHYWDCTKGLLKDHVDSFLQQLESLSSQANNPSINLADHPRLPLILKHNGFVQKTFLAVRDRYELW
jgi:hypothetical protein